MKKSICLLLASLSLLGLPSCGQRGSQAQSATETQMEVSSTIQPAPFEADSAYRYIQEQVALGVRAPGTAGHRACLSWLKEKLEGWGYSVTLQPFPGKDYHGKEITGTNIIATLHPDALDPTLLMAHWDTRPVADQDPLLSSQSQPILGADDGASGVAVLLELARQEALQPSGKALDFIFFDLEDGGSSTQEEGWCQGSQYWAKLPHRQTSQYAPKQGILLDMVGAEGARFYWEGLSKVYARPLLGLLWQTAHELGWGSYFVQADGERITDDHVFVTLELGVPSVDIINYDPTRATGFGTHWHTHTDALPIISRETLRAVGQTVATTLRDKL